MELILVFTILLLGFYGGTGFFVVMGGNPALMKMSAPAFVEYWQSIDTYMAVRMKSFGPMLLLTVISSSVILYFNYSSISFWCMVTALLILTVDLMIIFKFNHPLNVTIQALNLAALSENVFEIRDKVVLAFWMRSACMLSAFAMGLTAFWQR
jgi:hypothetical protein